MKKLLLLLFLIPNLAFSLPETLNQYISTHPNWKTTDMASLSYITTRCALLSLVLSEQYINHTDTEAKVLYKLTSTRASIFILFSDAIYKANGGTTKSFQERVKIWTKLYGEESVSNINVYGAFIMGGIANDLTTCGEQVFPLVEKVMLEQAN